MEPVPKIKFEGFSAKVGCIYFWPTFGFTLFHIRKQSSNVTAEEQPDATG
jgi:hypothetical protein